MSTSLTDYGSATADPLDTMFQVGDILDVGVIAVDTELRIQRCNAWICANTGHATPDDLIGLTIAEAFPEIGGTAKEDTFRRAVAGETIVLAHRFHEYLVPLPCPPNVECYEHMQQSARLVPRLVDGVVVGAVAFIQDVSERVAREFDLRVAKEAAEAASKAKSDFLAAMSHELRTPLSAVIGYAELLAHEVGGPMSDAQKQHAERITVSAWHLIAIIDQVLTFSRAEAGREELRMEELDICDACRKALTLVEPQAMQKGLQLAFTCDTPQIITTTDPLRIQQIMVNLLGNAVKFTDEGRVNVSIRRSGDELLISVSDTGPGVPETHREHIFEAFTQVDQTATRSKGGTGLGLPVSRKLAELLGGTLILEEPDGRAGSTFTLCLPTQPANKTP